MHKIDPRKKYSAMEQEQLAFWHEHDTFKKSVEQRSKDNAYVFYDGPPFITGVPHYGTLLSSIIKDIVPRYWTMKGKRVERVWGWDCHGLPAENLVEKKLGIKDKREVEKIGLEKYIDTCHTEMVQGGSLWEDTVERIGRWVNFKGAYKTMDKEYMESVWWAFKELYKKGKIYEGEKVLMYCTRCATPISKAEVAMDNSYQNVTDPSVYVKFPVQGKENTYFLAWTTTPWTLPANTALAVNPALRYAKVSVDDAVFIVAEDLVEKVFTDEKHQSLDYTIIEKGIAGKNVVGLAYDPLFDDYGDKAHRVLGADYVTTEDGTGVVHLAPAYGEEDFDAAQKEGVPVVHMVDDNGEYIDGEWKGKNIWEVNKQIAKELKERSVVFKIDYIRHEYPHCHRCDTKLMYRAHPSWFMDIAGQRKDMIAKNDINWFPEHIKEGRWKKTIEAAPDWNLSRDRFWASAIPVWKCDNEKCDHMQVVGSYAELKELSGETLEDYHRPYIDRVTFACEKCGGTMRRIEKVLDCWFESGSMPFAQFHYPFENKEKFEKNFPGDFIVEYVGQVRAWFYYVHAISVGLFGTEAFKNVIVTGTIAGNDGRKMSKSLGNYTASDELLEQYSADALRFLLVHSPLSHGDDYALIDKDVADIQRKLGTLWQSYSFFVMYALVDKWDAGESATKNEKRRNILDQWILSRLNSLIAEVDQSMQDYDLSRATKPILVFIDELSNWYIRRSRRRFWKSEDDVDKNEAYQTLYEVLVTLSKVIAPFTPFIAEEIFRNLTDEESVHLTDFPAAKTALIEEKLNQKMADTRKAIEMGLSLRAQNSLKVRQPLAKLEIVGADIDAELLELITDEVNVKAVKIVDKINPDFKSKADGALTVGLDITLTEELKKEGQMRELIRYIQQARKKAGLAVDDRIKVYYDKKSDVISTFTTEIAKEVLATDIINGEPDTEAFLQSITLGEEKLMIWIVKQTV